MVGGRGEAKNEQKENKIIIKKRKKESVLVLAVPSRSLSRRIWWQKSASAGVCGLMLNFPAVGVSGAGAARAAS